MSLSQPTALMKTFFAAANVHFNFAWQTVLSRLTRTALLLAPLAALQAAEFHVAQHGRDANAGTEAEPFATLQAGVNQLQPGDTLLVHGGVYRETITLPRSGTEQKPITLRSYKDEKAVITGCEPVTGWTKHKDNIWKAPMSWSLGTGRNQVFHGADVLIEARFPNSPSPGLGMPVSGLSRLWPTFGGFSNPDPVKQPARVVSKLLEGQSADQWKGGLYIGVHYAGYSVQTGLIEGSKSGEITIGDRTKTWWSAFPSHYKENGRGMIVGHMNALDEPGEWHWQDDMLFLVTPDGKPPVKPVEAKRRQLAVDMSGRSYIHLRGLTMHAASLLMAEAAHCVVDGCTLEYTSHFTRIYSAREVEHGRDTVRSGESGIFVSGHDNAFLNTSIRHSAGGGLFLDGYRHTVHNCLIDEVDYTSHYLDAIGNSPKGPDRIQEENLLTGGHTISFNTLRNAGRHIFSVSEWMTSQPSRTRSPKAHSASLFAHNHVYNGMLIGQDGGLLAGAYGSGGSLNGVSAQVIYNVLHDSHDSYGIEKDSLGMIYLDTATCDVAIRNNLLWAAPGSVQHGFFFHHACVNIHDHDNVFYQEFVRTSALLRPKDFPRGTPFRFGHDFRNPPPLPRWPQLETTRLEAEACATASPGIGRNATGLENLKDGDVFTFDGVNLDRSWRSVVMRFSSAGQALNADLSARAQPRHRKQTDPLVLEALARDGASPGIWNTYTMCGEFLDGDWVQFKQVPLAAGYRRFRVVYGNSERGARHLEVRLDSPDGPLVGRVALPQTDSPRELAARQAVTQLYGEADGEISDEVTGTHDVFLVFRSEDKKRVGMFEYLRFEKSRGKIPLQPNEVRIEIRAGSKDGEILGNLYPRFTGGADTFREVVATLEPGTLSGQKPLCFVVHSAIPGPIGTIDWISLEKAKEPMDMSGLGIPPVVRDGRFVYPEPTHRPLPVDIRRSP